MFPRWFELHVIKVGGSVLREPQDFQYVAAAIHKEAGRHPNRRYVIVVSAPHGVTQSLEVTAEALHPAPDPVALDLLWFTGEARSVSLFTLCLQAVGVSARALNAHQSGLIRTDNRNQDEPIQVIPNTIIAGLTACRAVVVPGFFATDPSGNIVSLGRGGSDLSAVLLAAALEADRCELIKDVPGYFTHDPKTSAAPTHLPELRYEEALRFAEAGSRLVQGEALKLAARTETPLVIRSLSADGLSTVVGRRNQKIRKAIDLRGVAAAVA